MPILDIEIVGEASPPPSSQLAQALADDAGRLFRAKPGTTWVRVRALAASGYAENASLVAAADRPVFVTVLKREVPTHAELADEIAGLTQMVARAVGRPAEHVHVAYEPAAAGRVAFGGKLVE
jgi:phenylpyruvate tautomerase PptA (4-oxalocrotonate tautomerase family)